MLLYTIGLIMEIIGCILWVKDKHSNKGMGLIALGCTLIATYSFLEANITGAVFNGILALMCGWYWNHTRKEIDEE